MKKSYPVAWLGRGEFAAGSVKICGKREPGGHYMRLDITAGLKRNQWWYTNVKAGTDQTV